MDPASSTSGPRPTSSQYLNEVRTMLAGVPPGHRRTMMDFWGVMRGGFDELDDHIRTLQAQVRTLQGAPQPVEADRPSTSGTVNDLRGQLQDALDQDARAQADVSETAENIWDLDPAWVTRLLKEHRSLARGGPLGCWESNSTAAHPNGYCKINLRNTNRPGRNPNRIKIGCQPFSHQLAIVAKGLGQSLLITCDGEYEVCRAEKPKVCPLMHE